MRRNFALAEPVPGPATEAPGPRGGTEHDARCEPVRAPGRGLYHNTAAVLDAGTGYVGKYRKMHIPDDPRYYEKFYFTPGDLGFKSFDTVPATSACWSAGTSGIRKPRASLRSVALRSCSIPPPSAGIRKSARRWAAPARRLGNHSAVARDRQRLLRGGRQPDRLRARSRRAGGIRFWGQSFIAAPDGSVMVRASADREEVIVCDLDLASVGSSGWAGRSSATGASMRIRNSRAASSTELLLLLRLRVFREVSI